MPDREKVIKAWKIFRDSNPYEICSGREFRAMREPEYCMGQMIEDTIEMLKKFGELQERHKILVEKADDMYSMLKEQENLGTELTNAVELIHKKNERIEKLMKEREIEEPHPWEHIWDAPDNTFKGRCRNCGFVHIFIQGHDAQYRFCPQCGEQKVT